MTTIVTRAGKGSPLTNAEVDQNFINLNTDKLEAGALSPYLLSATAASTYQTIAGMSSFATLTGAETLSSKTLQAPNITSGLSLNGLAGTSGQVLTSQGVGSVPVWANQSGGGGVQYVYKTANYTAAAGEGVLADTTGGAFTVTLPASPTVGAQVLVSDAGNVWGTNNLTVGRNGNTIANSASDLVCNINGVSVQLVYDGTTWEVFSQVGGVGGAGSIRYLYKTANYTASDKEYVLANTTGGAFTVTLPAAPTVGTLVFVADAGSDWGTNNLTVARNGSTISGLSDNLVCDISGVSVELVYDGTTWRFYAQIGGVGGSTYASTGKAIAMSIVFGG